SSAASPAYVSTRVRGCGLASVLMQLIGRQAALPQSPYHADSHAYRCGPLLERAADALQVIAFAHDLLIAGHSANPFTHADVRCFREVDGGQPHERGTIHPGGRDTELADQAVLAPQMLEELQLRSP